jgi:cell division protein FtsI (penicillin-binding protein 3)
MKPEFVLAKDTLHTHIPVVKSGNMKFTHAVLEDLGINCRLEDSGELPECGKVVTENNKVVMKSQAMPKASIVPDMTGLGARDAVFMAERLGLKVQLEGTGIVRQQSLPFGHHIVKGEKIILRLGITNAKEIQEPYKTDIILFDTTQIKTDTLKQPEP